MTIQLVLFDIGGVLEIAPGGMEPARQYPDLFARWDTRLDRPAGDTDGRLGAVMGKLSAQGKNGAIGTCTEEEWMAEMRAHMGLDDPQMRAFMREFWDVYLGEPNTEMRRYVMSLRPRYRVAMLSNSFVGARREEEERYGYAAMGEVILYSHELGVAKPDRRIYELTCERLGLRPDEIVFLDDHDAYVAGARAAGIPTVQFRNNEQAIADIEALLARG